MSNCVVYRFSWKMVKWIAQAQVCLRSWLVEIYRGTHKENFRIFIDSLEGLYDRLHFFILQKFLPRRLLRHIAEFDHVSINEYPARYQNLRGSIKRTEQSGLSSYLRLIFETNLLDPVWSAFSGRRVRVSREGRSDDRRNICGSAVWQI